ncbi:NAD-dependent epimerase/dehydratase family protein [Nocardioides marmoriginsengisoli]|nr:NAD-dependent epimerase/dehydratase family protein [Nocardioides marmoriginsengisoli]
MTRTALIAGATGLVGSHLLDQLLADDHWDRVVSVGRREVDRSDPKLTQLIVPFPGIGDLPAADDVFSCLGTTIKVAGSQDAFRAVDHDAVVALAEAAHRAGATQFLHVTALGASARSRIFYNRVKGETERDVSAAGVPATVAFRPSMIDGTRPDVSRPGESVGLVAMRAVGPLLGRFRPNRASDIAAAMIREAKASRPGHRVVDAGALGRA